MSTSTAIPSPYNTYTPRVGFVTGAAQGIGEAIALRLADEGIDVAVLDLKGQETKLENVVQQIQAKGRKSVAVYGDVSKEEDVKNAVDKVVIELGSLDIMVANAGIAQLKGILEMPFDEWKNIQSVNVDGTMLCYKYAGLQMVKQERGGRIIGPSSITGKRGCFNACAYSTTKFAIRGLTQCAALDLAQYGITVNAYAPSIIETPMAANEIYDSQYGDRPGDAFRVISKLPMDGTPSAPATVVAGLVAYLIKPEAYFITGQSISINGGYFFD
ncbi:short-chain dehydrogenases/reductases (SDR) family protein [Abortiporus biennis]